MGKREDDQRYRKSVKGKAAIASYRQSEAGRAATARYRASEKYRQTEARYRLEKRVPAPGTVECGVCHRHVKREDAATLGRRVGRLWICDEC